MAKRPMKTPGAPGAAMNSARIPRETTSMNRHPMGVGAYRLVDDASATDVHKGMVEVKAGSGKGDANMGTNAPSKNVSAQATLGASFTIKASRAAYTETYPGTLAAGRIMRPAIHRTDEFYGDAASYGPLGPVG